MIKYVFSYSLILINGMLLAQSNTKLTKEETVEYINKRSKEVVGYTKANSAGEVFTIKDQFCKLTSDNKIERSLERVRIGYDFNPNYGQLDRRVVNIEIYNPAHIQSIELGASTNEAEAVGTIVINLLPQSARHTFQIYNRFPDINKYIGPSGPDDLRAYAWNWVPLDKNKGGSGNEQASAVYLYFLKTDPSNFNRLKRALEHLRDLCKAEKDPFGD